MTRTLSVVLLSLLLVAAFAQDDINVEKKGVKGRRVGGWENVDLTNFESVEDEKLVNEAVEQSRKVYQDDAENNKWGELDEILSVKKQIVSGILYRILWTTVNGDHIEITVHQVPWQEASEKRYPVIKGAVQHIKKWNDWPQ